jgi:predicted AAA+ superfamily ATPase
MNDTGLLVALYGNDVQKQILEGNLGTYKGAVYENLVFSILNKKQYDVFYFDQYKGFEVDFIYTDNQYINAIEIKSGNGRAKSLKMFYQEYIGHYQNLRCMKFTNRNYGETNEFATFPQ